MDEERPEWKAPTGLNPFWRPRPVWQIIREFSVECVEQMGRRVIRTRPSDGFILSCGNYTTG